MNYNDYIEANAEIMFGKPVVKGARLTVAHILTRMSEGATSDDLLAAYPNLTHESTMAVLAFDFYVVSNGAVITAA